MPRGYSRTQVRLHWTITGMIAVQCISGSRISTSAGMPAMDRLIPLVVPEYLHVGVGALIFALTIWRIVLRSQHGVPSLPRQDNAVIALAARLQQGGLIAVIVLMGVTGIATWLGFDNARESHSVLQIVLYALVGLHITAALMHQFVLRDGLLTRILRPRREPSGQTPAPRP